MSFKSSVAEWLLPSRRIKSLRVDVETLRADIEALKRKANEWKGHADL